MFVDPDADVCHTWHDFPFHIVLDTDMKRIAFCQTDGIHVESILVMVDACTSDGSFLLNQMTVQGVVMALA